MISSFLDYQLNHKTHILSKTGQTIELTKKEWDILLIFINRPREIIDKQRLIDIGWEGRFVPDATLYKQIQRLREKLKSNTHQDPLIETIRGVGFKFNADVETQQTSNDKPPLQSHTYKKRTSILFPATLIFLLVSLVWWRTSDKDSDSLSVVSDARAAPLTLMIMPEIDLSTQKDRMATGAASYLIHALQSNSALQIKRISDKTLRSKDAQTHAIEMTHSGDVEASLTFDLKESNNLFESNAVIRNNNGILAQKKFTEVTLKALFDQIKQWMNTELGTFNDIDTIDSSIMSTNNYAVENYIRAMTAQFNGDASVAIKFLDLAVSEDSQFWLAWYELAIALRKQGNNEKALSILTTLNTTDTPASFKLMISNAHTITLWRIGELDQALEIAENGIELAEKLNKNKIRSALLVNKAIILKQQNKPFEAEKSLTLALQIKQEINDNPAQLAATYNTLAGVQQQQGKLEKAIESVELAIQGFSTAGDKRYETSAKGRLASIYSQQGHFDKAFILMGQNLIAREQLTDIPGQISSLLKMQKIQRIRGEFIAVQNSLDRIESLLLETNNRSLQKSYELARAEYYLQTGQRDEAEIYLKDLENEGFNTPQQTRIVLHYHYLAGNYVKMQQILDSIEDQEQLSRHPLILKWQAQLELQQGLSNRAQSTLNQARINSKNDGDYLTQVTVYNASIAYALQYDLETAQQLIKALDNKNTPPYPFIKLKARYLASQGKYFEAAQLMQELKLKANALWQADDQLQLESFGKQITNSAD